MDKIKCAHDEMLEIHKIQPNPKNPNRHPEKQIELLTKIIDYQGQRSPLVISSRSGYLVKGHGRLEAIKKLGWDKAAVDYQDYESEAQEHADMIADNKIAELSEPDEMMIQDLVKEMGEIDFDLLGIPDFLMIDINTVDEIKEKEIDENIETTNRCPSCDYVW